MFLAALHNRWEPPYLGTEPVCPAVEAWNLKH